MGYLRKIFLPHFGKVKVQRATEREKKMVNTETSLHAQLESLSSVRQPKSLKKFLLKQMR